MIGLRYHSGDGSSAVHQDQDFPDRSGRRASARPVRDRRILVGAQAGAQRPDDRNSEDAGGGHAQRRRNSHQPISAAGGGQRLRFDRAPGTKLVGFARLFVDFEASSLWHRAYTFRNIDIDSPFANAVIFKDGRLNLAQLSPRPSDQPQPKNDEPIPALRIGSFKVTGGFLDFDDRRRPSDFATRLQPINFELQNFTTGIDGGRFTFTGMSKLGERIEWHGHLVGAADRIRRRDPDCRAAGAHHLGIPGGPAELPGQFRKNRPECELSVLAEGRRPICRSTSPKSL